MSAYKITDELLRQLKNGVQFICVNYCNADMMGHTGDINSAIKAVEVLDDCLGKITKAVNDLNGATLITADHGNIEEMVNIKTKEVDTEHSAYPVPFILVSDQYKTARLKNNGILGDVAPTILNMLNLKKPKEMKGKSLIES